MHTGYFVDNVLEEKDMTEILACITNKEEFENLVEEYNENCQEDFTRKDVYEDLKEYLSEDLPYEVREQGQPGPQNDWDIDLSKPLDTLDEISKFANMDLRDDYYDSSTYDVDETCFRIIFEPRFLYDIIADKYFVDMDCYDDIMELANEYNQENHWKHFVEDIKDYINIEDLEDEGIDLEELDYSGGLEVLSKFKEDISEDFIEYCEDGDLYEKYLYKAFLDPYAVSGFNLYRDCQKHDVMVWEDVFDTSEVRVAIEDGLLEEYLKDVLPEEVMFDKDIVAEFENDIER